MTVYCQKPGCDRTWPRDPALEIACPECGAPIGERCKRPSGHRVWGGRPHKPRYIAAVRAGCHGPCPSGRCFQPADLPLDTRAGSRQDRQPDLFSSER